MFSISIIKRGIFEITLNFGWDIVVWPKKEVHKKFVELKLNGGGQFFMI